MLDRPAISLCVFVLALSNVTTVTAGSSHQFVQVTKSEFDCSGKSDGYYPSATSCTSFYMCAGGLSLQAECHLGLLFNPISLYCDFPDHVTCYTQSTVPVRETTTSSTTVPAPKTTRAPTTRSASTTDAPITSSSTVSTNTSTVRTSTASVKQTTASSGIHTTVATTQGDYRRVCYYGSWAMYRNSPNGLHAGDIDPNLCTHLVFSFAALQDNGTQLRADNDDDLHAFPSFTNLKQQNPRLKTMLAVGGWTMGSKPFMATVASADNMHKFANKTIHFLRQHNFDGLDIDWEYPAARGSPAKDKTRFTQLLQMLLTKNAATIDCRPTQEDAEHMLSTRQLNEIIQNAFIHEPNRGNNDRLLLSVAVGGGESRARQSYQISGVARHVDFINLMLYDFHGSWENTVNVHSSMYSDDGLNVHDIVQYWESHGAPKSKLNVGIPFYGQKFTLANAHNSGVGAPHTGKGTGAMPYYQICKLIKAHHLTEHMLQKERVPYFVHGTQWVGYDNKQSILEKAEYVKSNHIGGVMVWAIDLDDTSGACGEGKYPLMNTLKNGLLGQGTGGIVG